MIDLKTLDGPGWFPALLPNLVISLHCGYMPQCTRRKIIKMNDIKMFKVGEEDTYMLQIYSKAIKLLLSAWLAVVSRHVKQEGLIRRESYAYEGLDDSIKASCCFCHWPLHPWRSKALQSTWMI